MTPKERVETVFTTWEELKIPVADWEPGTAKLQTMLADAIQEAVVAERERCAKVAEDTAAGDHADTDLPGWAAGVRLVARCIAARIRKGGAA